MFRMTRGAGVGILEFGFQIRVAPIRGGRKRQVDFTSPRQ
jgi:hypothetical protein